MMKVTGTGYTAQGSGDEGYCRKKSPEMRPEPGAGKADLVDGRWNVRGGEL